MLTLRFDRLGLQPGDMFLDAGAGFGRHAYEAARQGATVFALDYAQDEVMTTRATFAAMSAAKTNSVAHFVEMQQDFRSLTTPLIAWLLQKYSNTFRTMSLQSQNLFVFSNQVARLA